YRKHILQLLIGMIAASFISLLFPLLTRLLVDIGIQNKNLNFVLLIVFSQIFLFLGDSAISIIRSWLLLYINTRISLNIISDFLGKLLKLP
ncbi:peptidase domain-containing ABC transporter, partial [Acinetobacter baumannii]